MRIGTSIRGPIIGCGFLRLSHECETLQNPHGLSIAILGPASPSLVRRCHPWVNRNSEITPQMAKRTHGSLISTVSGMDMARTCRSMSRIEFSLSPPH